MENIELMEKIKSALREKLDYDFSVDIKNGSLFVECSWEEGYGGGDCWGNEARWFSEPEPKHDDVFTVLAEFVDFSYSKYLKANSSWEYSDFYCGGYYGNSITRYTKTINITYVVEEIFK